MRILRIANIPSSRTGGMSRAIYCTGDVLVEMGHQVDYLTKEQLQTNVPYALRRRVAVPLKVPFLVHQLMQQGKIYDVVEIHEEIAAPYCLMRHVWKHLPPVVVFSHGLEKRHQLAELSYRKQKNLPLSFALRHLRITVLQAVYSLKHCDHIICLNSEDAAYLRQIGIADAQITQAHNGVELEFQQAGELTQKLNLQRSGILFLGAWILRKGTLDLIPAITTVLRSHPSLQFTVAGCGSVEKHILAEFPKDLHTQINILPLIANNQDLINIYQQHSMLVLPSYFEGQPLVMLEAAAMGLAIATTNTCGMADFIKNEINGLVFSVGDTAALTNALKRLIADEVLINKLSESARQTIKPFTWKNAAEKIAKAYQQAVYSTQNQLN